MNVKLAPDLKVVRPYAVLGPRIDFYIDSKYSGSDYDVSGFTNHLDSLSKSPVFGFNAGVGVDILKALPLQLFVELIFNKQISFNKKLSSAFQDQGRKYLLRSYEFNLGVRF